MPQGFGGWFPPFILKVALQQYLGNRCVAIENNFSHWVQGCCGIIAGCGHAVALLGAYMSKSVGVVCSVCPSITVRVVVDDMEVEAQADSEEAVVAPWQRLLKLGPQRWASCRAS